jgi:MFS family permease
LDPEAPSRTGIIVAVLAGAGIVVSLMQTLIVPLIPRLPEMLHTTPSDATWAVTATLLTGAVATPVVGRLGDLYGKRRMLLISAVILAVGSVVCAMTDALIPMVVGRALQGMGVGVIPLGISIMRDVLPPQRLGSAIALMSSSLGVGGALGLPASAAVAQNADWHVLFWASAGCGVLIAVLAALIVPESPLRTGGRFDVIGAVGLLAGLTALLLPVSKGGDWGWGSGRTLGLFAASVVILVLWGWWELSIRGPLVDLRTTARRQVLLTNLASIVIGFAMLAMSLIAPQLLQLPTATGYGLGQSLLGAGLWMAPAGLVMMAVSPIAARVSAAYGPKVSLLSGSLVIAAGYGIALPLMSSAFGVLVFGAVISAGVGLAYSAMPALIMGAVPISETAAANGFNSLMRSLGTSTSSTVIGVVLSEMTLTIGGHEVPSPAGFRTGFLIGAGVAVVAALVVLTIPGRSRRGRVEEGRGHGGAGVEDLAAGPLRADEPGRA